MLIGLHVKSKLQTGVASLSHGELTMVLFPQLLLGFSVCKGEEEIEQSSRAKTFRSVKVKGASQSRPKPLLGWLQEQVDMV